MTSRASRLATSAKFCRESWWAVGRLAKGTSRFSRPSRRAGRPVCPPLLVGQQMHVRKDIAPIIGVTPNLHDIARKSELASQARELISTSLIKLEFLLFGLCLLLVWPISTANNAVASSACYALEHDGSGQDAEMVSCPLLS